MREKIVDSQGHFALGFTLGLSIFIVVVLSFEVLSDASIIASDAVAAILGSLVGGIVAGLAAFIVHAISERNLRQRELREETSKRQEEIFRFNVGYSQMLAVAKALKRHIDSCYSDFHDIRTDLAEAWQVVVPSTGAPIPNEFYSINDLRLLFESQEFDLITRIQAIQNKILANLHAFERYSTLREEFSKRIPADSMDGAAGVAILPVAMKRWLDKDEAALNILLNEIVSTIDDDVEEAEAILEPLAMAIKSSSGVEEFSILQKAID